MNIFNNTLLKSPDQLTSLLDNIKVSIKLNLDLQLQYKETLIKYMQKVSECPNEFIDKNTTDAFLDFLKKLEEKMELCNNNVTKLNKLQNSLNKLYDFNTNPILSDFYNNYTDAQSKIVENNLQIEKFFNSAADFFSLSFIEPRTIKSTISKKIPENQEILDNITSNDIINIEDNNENNIKNIENTNENIKNIVESDLENTLQSGKRNKKKNKKKKKNKDNSYEESNIDIPNNVKNTTLVSDTYNDNKINSEQDFEIDENKYTENTLLISELQGKIVLPYYLSDLKEILFDNIDKYSSFDDVIDDLYTLPYNYYHSPSIGRFKEAFKLIRTKEKGSIKEAFDLGMEVLFKYNLHPAIISACRDLDELDIYLDCLEYNETEDFSCFDIKYEIAPVLVKKRA